MRDRHFPRLCHSCQAPMARQENACWRCGANWVTEDDPTTTLRLVSAGAYADARSTFDAGMSTTPAGDDRAAALARLDADRWIDEGGTLAAVPSERLAARSAQ
jgi:predicted amidophosphoribosyltransferase